MRGCEGCYAKEVRGIPEKGRSAFPWARQTPVVRDRQHSHRFASELVPDGIRKSPKDPFPVAIDIDRMLERLVRDLIDGIEYRLAKGIRDHRIALAIPAQCLPDVRLRRRRKNDDKATHKSWSRARASDHGTACAAPLRSSAFRVRISSAHAMETDASSTPSRLSSSVRTTAERSSGASASASSMMWSTRAFMFTRVALQWPRRL